MMVFNSHRFLPLSVVQVRCRRLQDLLVPVTNSSAIFIAWKKTATAVPTRDQIFLNRKTMTIYMNTTFEFDIFLIIL